MGKPKTVTDGDFAAEFNAWDIASDEALENFEKGLDKP